MDNDDEPAAIAVANRAPGRVDAPWDDDDDVRPADMISFKSSDDADDNNDGNGLPPSEYGRRVPHISHVYTDDGLIYVHARHDHDAPEDVDACMILVLHCKCNTVLCCVLCHCLHDMRQ